MPPWPNFPPWPCLHSQLPSNTELSLLCHNDESGRTLRLRTTCYKTSDIMLVYRQWYKTSDTGWWYTYPSEKYEFVSWDDDILIYIYAQNNPNVPNHQPGYHVSCKTNKQTQTQTHTQTHTHTNQPLVSSVSMGVFKDLTLCGPWPQRPP